MKFREYILESGTTIFLGRDAKNNDELVKKFKGKENIILHTAKPGSPFCVIESLTPSKEDLIASGAICASKSQDWRDNKSDVRVHIFTGKDVKKEKGMKIGMCGVKKFRTILIKKGRLRSLSAKNNLK